jgi:alkylation response protein AidB-like acyl-CoA dehydrogenase
MDFSLSEEQQEVQNLARKILEDLSTHERLVEVEASDEGIDRELWRELGKSNLLGVGLPEAFDGSDLGFMTLCLLLQEIGRGVAAVPAIPTLVAGALPIAEFGSDAQKQSLLPGVVNGNTLLSAALQEAGNPDPTRPSVTASPAGDGWRIEGTKICVPAAPLATRILVPARTHDGKIGVFLVAPNAEGLRLSAQATTNRERHFEMEFAGTPVGADDLLGDLEGGAAILHWIVDRATAACCALQLGVSEKALQMTAEYTRTREQFDRPIGSFQAVHQRVGDAFIDLEAMRLTAWQATWQIAEGRDASDALAVAKYWAAVGGQRLGYACQHLHGGIGIDIDYPLHRYYLWAKQLELTLGSAPVQLERIGTQLAETPSA